MTFGKPNGSRIRIWCMLVLAACIWCGVVYWLAVNAGWQAVAILLVISVLLRLVWATAIKRARVERTRQAKLAAVMQRQPDQNHKWDRPTDTGADAPKR
jgi:membrane protein implicated in regulation of membrane protease activity